MNSIRKKVYLILLIIFTIALVINIIQRGDGVMKGKEITAMIPRKVLFGNPEKSTVRLSHDGKYMSYLAPYNGVMNIYVASIDQPEKAEVISNDTKRGIRNYFWAYNNKQIVYMQDEDGDENWHIYSVDLKTKQTRDLTPIKGSMSSINNVSLNFPNEILIDNNQRRKDYFDLYRLNLETGKMDLIYKNDVYGSLITDLQYRIRFGHKQTEDGGAIIDLLQANTTSVSADTITQFSVQEFLSISPDDVYTTNIIGFDAEGNNLYMIDSRSSNTAGLYNYDLLSNQQLMLYNNPIADIDGILSHPVTHKIEAAEYTYDRSKRQFFDDIIAADFTYLSSQQEGEIEVLSRTIDDTKWIIAYVADNKAVEYYLYNRQEKDEQKKLKYLCSNRSDLANYKLSQMHPVEIPSRDNKPLVSYLSLPIEIDITEGQDIKSRESRPLVLYVHGGPTARDQWGFHPVHQWLTNRGYAVLSVNYRGSTGFGKKFINDGNGEWAGKMHNDLIDAAEWAIKKGITTKDKIAIMGGSYGGYAALVGLTFTPEFFNCAIDIVGPSSLITLLNSIPPYWKPYLHSLIRKVGGNPNTEEGRQFLDSRSPLSFIDKIKKPLLIGQGANDPRVKQQESDQIVEAMQKKGIPVSYILYPDEGHGFARPQNRISFYAMTEKFLAENLSGRFEPLGQDTEDSTMQIKVWEGVVSEVQQNAKSSN